MSSARYLALLAAETSVGSPRPGYSIGQAVVVSHLTATLLLSCADRPGIVASVSGFIADHNGNILGAEQHQDPEAGVFFQRVEFELDGLDLDRDEIAGAFAPLVEQFAFDWRLHFSDERPRIGVLVTRQGHCLHDLLARWQMGDLHADVVLVAGNHLDLEPVATAAGVPFHHLPVTPDTRGEQEAQMIDLLDRHDVDVVVLARYMQILTDGFVAHYPGRIINIHHSFLPAFPGGRPYHQAHSRGVKIIGATAHYATADLDEGPIIEQDVVRCSHRDSVDALVRRGRDLETVVLARAVRAHVEHRILVYGNKTVVFG